ncbi:MAG: OmpA family protein [Chitinophagaceae bacterium]
MKRILLTSVLLIFLFSLAHGQVRIALQGGLHTSTIKEQNDLPYWDIEKQSYKPRTGIHLGFLADIPFKPGSPFYFQSGVTFYNKGRQYQFSKDSTVVITRPLMPDSVVNTFYYTNRKEHLNYIDIPFNLVFKQKIGKNAKFIIGGGPYVSFFYSGLQKSESVVVGVSYENEESDDLPVGKGDGKYKTLDLGYNVLTGFEFGRVYLTANFSQSLSNVYKPDTYTASSYKHHVVGGTIGIFLGKQAPSDKDRDGVPDSKDKCPEIAGLPELKGCPDTDNDGLGDSEDGCPGIAGPADNKGCPYPDADNDGVFDKDDLCPDKPGAPEDKGCPPADTDNDGITDKEDACPTQAGVARYQGCPIPDKDADGVNDENDRCPDVKGPEETGGCPVEVREEVKKAVSYAASKIQFKVNSTVLAESSYAVLDKLALLLKDNPELRLLIEGHTSSDGTYDANMKLSQKRADAVKQFLVKLEISADRLTAVGVGPNKPLNSGRTPAERVANRRVEIQVSNQ